MAKAKQKSFKRGNWTDEPCFYVSARDGEKHVFLLGPFRQEADCRKWAYVEETDGGDRAKHLKLMNLCYELDPKAPWYGYGMAKAENGYSNGSLNDKLGLTSSDLYGEDKAA